MPCNLQGNRLKTQPTLSICIPTYNFGEFIEETLQSILRPKIAKELLEVIVLDGGSTDRTPEIVSSYSNTDARVHYYRQEFRGGIDKDIISAVELSTGQYIWLFSADDVMREYALPRLIELLGRTHPQVLLCHHSQNTRDLQILGEYPIFRSLTRDCWQISNGEQRLEYLRNAVNTEALFSYLGGMIIRRDVWFDAQLPSQFLGTSWAHAARLISYSKTHGLEVCVVEETWIDKRGDNDSFLSDGLLNRLRIAVDGYLDIVEYFYGSSSMESKQVRRMLRNELKPGIWIDARRSLSGSLADKELFARLVFRLYGPSTAHSPLRWIITTLPLPLLELLRYTKRVMKLIWKTLCRTTGGRETRA